MNWISLEQNMIQRPSLVNAKTHPSVSKEQGLLEKYSKS